MSMQRVRLSKTWSKIGFFVGCIFCLAGILMSIAIFVIARGFNFYALFPLVWTFCAWSITYIHYKNGFTDDAPLYYKMDIPDYEDDLLGETLNNDSANQEVGEASDFDEKLRSLERLNREGLISYAEYFNKREEIMKKQR